MAGTVGKGDRVVTNNKNQTPIHGTVRWTGTADTDGGKVNVVGIETVRTVVCCEVSAYTLLFNMHLFCRMFPSKEMTFLLLLLD